jgi:hypothetical protein
MLTGSAEYYTLRSITEVDAKDFFKVHHDKSCSLNGRKFSLVAYDDSMNPRAVVVVVSKGKKGVGRESERIMEIHRCCSDGCNPKLVATLVNDARRALQALGYRNITVSPQAYKKSETSAYMTYMMSFLPTGGQ